MCRVSVSKSAFKFVVPEAPEGDAEQAGSDAERAEHGLRTVSRHIRCTISVAMLARVDDALRIDGNYSSKCRGLHAGDVWVDIELTNFKI